MANTHGELPLITKPIPSSGEQIPFIGLGINVYSVNAPGEMMPLPEVIVLMLELVGTVVDTARVYGRSEEVIGEIVEKLGKRVVSIMPVGLTGRLTDARIEMIARV
jgi:aryl-alcohol dehydrogenase-like predicted oxidoreductase